ncbi:hypothetical protein ABZ816_26290 [Actinosynnema sp. NPDC047251]|uniref:Uncharacterized protein n=1 Tax=Saccharothrix espanaensis (strain ATCC 51144 / DSM 44229 / JCM 9112 / NBRC 15066 / NRRL 15764) TaxID=1179773 RepID=K0K5J0_SACES|nr:hypothetical protein [Saccharothrix espanaensis]CCH32099.1 hypothetical protein BN6_48270 [Saccharothrix espanaensis DSM 44229]
MDYLLDLALLVALLLALFGLLVWARWRKERKVRREHAAALAALAHPLGGRVVGPAEARAWSADLLPPLANETGGFTGRLGTVRRPRFETAVDFRRGDWSVRLSEASMRKATATSTTTLHQHRVEVAVSGLPELKLCRRIHVDFRGRPLAEKHLREVGPAGDAPLTVAREQRPWSQVRLPAEVDREFTAFSTDPATVTRAFTPQVADWLLGHADSDPLLSAMPILLTAEAGFVYTTGPGRIDPEQVLRTVDLVLGLLDRLRATPAHPPITP